MEKCNFKSAKKHYCIIFAPQKFKITKNAIFGLFSGAKIDFLPFLKMQILSFCTFEIAVFSNFRALCILALFASKAKSQRVFFGKFFKGSGQRHHQYHCFHFEILRQDNISESVELFSLWGNHSISRTLYYSFFHFEPTMQYHILENFRNLEFLSKEITSFSTIRHLVCKFERMTSEIQILSFCFCSM